MDHQAWIDRYNETGIWGPALKTNHEKEMEKMLERKRRASQKAKSPRAKSPRAKSPRAKSPAIRSPRARSPTIRSPGFSSRRELSPPLGTRNNWQDEQPRSMKERREMDPLCFLDTNAKGDPTYPICSAGTTRVSCRGVTAALRRGGQYHNQKVIAEAQALNEKYVCTDKERQRQEKLNSPVRRPGRPRKNV